MHSEAVTHISLNKNEMIKVATKLIDELNKLSSSSILAIPMGGFSSEDKIGGAIENIELRELFKKVVLKKANKNIKVTVHKEHISSKSFAKKIYNNLNKLINENGECIGPQ